MTQVKTEQHQEELTVLQTILQIIATDPMPDYAVVPILHLARSITGAHGACFILFGEPEICVTDGNSKELSPQDEELKTLISNLNRGIHLNPVESSAFGFPGSSWLVAPIYVQDRAAGAMMLNFDDDYQHHADNDALLSSVVDGLTVVTINAQSQARHERFNLNQVQFLRIVSHDLRSPLTSMLGFASMLESDMVGELNEKQSRFVEKILSGVAQMTSLVDNIQDAGRFDPETGFYEIERSPVDPVEMVKGIVRTQLVPAEKQELTIRVNTADNVPIINVDTNMLERALTNLVDNAIKYTPNGSTIEIEIKRAEDQIIISVQDNGLGISPEDQRRLFQRHVRIRRKEHKRVKGTGLGLFIVRSVAQHHGGKAWVESVENEGSTFYIGIPLKGANLPVP